MLLNVPIEKSKGNNGNSASNDGLIKWYVIVKRQNSTQKIRI